MGYVIALVLVAGSILAMWISGLATRAKDYATLQRGGGGLARRRMRPGEAVFAYTVVFLILALVLAPHLGLLLLSFATVWSFSPLPDAFTLAHYARVFGDSSVYIKNTLIYASLAGLIDVVLGVAIAYLVLRTRLIGREWLDWAATAALAVPGVVLGIGYLRTFYGVTLPGGQPLATLWVTIVLALAVRRLPYALRACYAALQQISVSLEEAAENLGATKRRTIRRVVVPLMMGGILAGFVSSFATAAVELSATLMLVQSDADAPLAYGLYVFMQSAAGRGPGAALGVIAVAMVALGSLASHLLIEPTSGRAWRERAPTRVPRCRRSDRWRRPLLRRAPGPQARGRRGAPGRVLRLPRPIRLRQDHTPAPHRRLQPGRQRPRADRRTRRVRLAALDARRRHGFPILCAVAAHDGSAQRRLRA